MSARVLLAFLAIAGSACAGRNIAATEIPMRGEAATVLVFSSPGCHCMRAHVPRLRALYDRFHDRGVAFFLVDSEVGASKERDETEARGQGLPYPVLIDAGAKIAEEVGADYASFTVVADAKGRVRYRGGIDSDRDVLHDDAVPYVASALEDVLAGREPRFIEEKALGCALRKW
jgi:hypothetical protein